MSDHKALAKHSWNYMLATLATKALAFVSIPVYTRIMSIEEYGIVGVFMSITGIVTVLLTLDSEVAVSRYYYEATGEKDFKRFVGTTVNLACVIFIIMSLLFVVISPFLSERLSFPLLLTLSLIPVSLYSATNSVFTQIYNPMRKSKKVAIVSSVQTYLAFGLSVICIILLKDEKYYGYVWGHILAMIILSAYIIKQVRPYYTSCFDKSHIKYIFNYCLPYIPYSLSGILLAQFSRIFIGNAQGYSLAGSYTLTTNVASLMMIVISITHKAWNPYYFQYMRERDYQSLDSDYNLIWRVTLVSGFLLSSFGYEMALVLSKGGDYMETVYVLPVLVLGYVFYQWAYVYLRNTGFAKRNIWNAYCVIFSGIVNIALNALLVPKFREIGAAAATFSSYMVLLMAAYLTNRFVLREYAPPMRNFIGLFLMSIPFFICIVILYTKVDNIFISLIIKVTLSFVFCYIMLKPYKEKMKGLATQLKEKTWKNR